LAEGIWSDIKRDTPQVSEENQWVSA
jgi:hypothetical protein